jgi:hypothetical protein
MDEERSGGSDVLGKVKIGALVALGAMLLWFLIVNLGPTWELSLWPFQEKIPAPGTIYIFMFLLIGAVIGFILCFYWLRGDRLREAILMLTEQGKRSPRIREESRGGSGQPARAESPAQDRGGEQQQAKPGSGT